MEQFTEFLLEDVSPKTIKKLLLVKYSPEILENTAKKYGFQSIDDLITDVKNRVAFKINNTEQYDPKTQELYKLMMFLVEWKEKYNLDIFNYYGVFQAMTGKDDLIRAKNVDDINMILEIAYENAKVTDFALLNGLYKGNDIRLVYENEHCWIYQVVDGKILCNKGIGRDTSWCVLNPSFFNDYSKVSYFYIVYPKDKKIYEKVSGAYRKFSLRLPKNKELAEKVFLKNAIVIGEKIMNGNKLEGLIKLRGSRNPNENFETVFNNVTKIANSISENIAKRIINKFIYLRTLLKLPSTGWNASYITIIDYVIRYYLMHEDNYSKMTKILVNILIKNSYKREEFDMIKFSDKNDIQKTVTYIKNYSLFLDKSYKTFEKFLEHLVYYYSKQNEGENIIITNQNIIENIDILKNFVGMPLGSICKNLLETITLNLFGFKKYIPELYSDFAKLGIFDKEFDFEDTVQKIIDKFKNPKFPDNFSKIDFFTKNQVFDYLLDMLDTFKRPEEKNPESFMYLLIYKMMNFNFPVIPDYIDKLYGGYIEDFYGQKTTVNDYQISPFEWTNERQYVKYLKFSSFVKDKENYQMVKDFIEGMYPEFFYNNNITEEDINLFSILIEKFKKELTDQRFVDFFNILLINLFEMCAKNIVENDIKVALNDALRYSEKFSIVGSKIKSLCNIITSEFEYISKDEFNKKFIYLLEVLNNAVDFILLDNIPEAREITIQLIFSGFVSHLHNYRNITPDEPSPEFLSKLEPIQRIIYEKVVPEGKLATEFVNYYKEKLKEGY